MAHSFELKNCNVVIIANIFNISILNMIWLYKNNIFTEKELEGTTCLPVLVEIQNDNFHLNLVPDRLQFSISPKYKNAKKLILSKIGTLIKALPHTPFVAAGLNFTYHVTPEDNDIYTLSRSLFCNDKSKLFENLDSEDVRFGGYFSKDIIDTRFRLDVKPISLTKNKIKEEKLQFSYNFNINLTQDDDYQKIIDLFNKWDEAKKITNELTNKINREV